jgi:hypothetical protein
MFSAPSCTCSRTRQRGALPSDFPPVSAVRYYFDTWTRIPDDSHMSLLDQALK